MYLGFHPQYKSPIKKSQKTKTLRYREKLRKIPEPGDEVKAVVSHDEGPFAVLEVNKVESLEVSEILESDFSGHKNYDSLSHFNQEMSKFYEKNFNLNDIFVLVSFTTKEIRH